MIVGHADATGRETSNLALSAARAEVVRSMLRARGIAPASAVRAQRRHARARCRPAPSGRSWPINRRVTFTVSTSD